jgi:toluene monooxygenase system protein E
VLDRLFAPLLYPLHGLQMIAAYVGQMAPNGRIAVAALFQCADEMRRIQRIGYRVTQLQQTWPQLARAHKERWMHDAAWQPLREAVERLLVAYDWAESFVALNLCLKPALDELVTLHLANTARAQGDYPLAGILGSAQSWVDRWSPVALSAVAALSVELDALAAEDGTSVADLIEHEMHERMRALDFRVPGAGTGRCGAES